MPLPSLWGTKIPLLSHILAPQACITWTNEVSNCVDAVCVSYYPIHRAEVLMFLMSSLVSLGVNCTRIEFITPPPTPQSPLLTPRDACRNWCCTCCGWPTTWRACGLPLQMRTFLTCTLLRLHLCKSWLRSRMTLCEIATQWDALMWPCQPGSGMQRTVTLTNLLVLLCLLDWTSRSVVISQGNRLCDILGWNSDRKQPTE